MNSEEFNKAPDLKMYMNAHGLLYHIDGEGGRVYFSDADLDFRQDFPIKVMENPDSITLGDLLPLREWIDRNKVKK